LVKSKNMLRQYCRGLICRNSIWRSNKLNECSWKRQVVVALSTTEVEYMEATHESKEAVWLQILCSSIGLVQQAIRIECDSQSAIFLAKNLDLSFKDKAY
jgi:hypothetical protein